MFAARASTVSSELYNSMLYCSLIKAYSDSWLKFSCKFGTLLISKFTVTLTKNLRRKEFMYILQETYLKPVSFP